MMNVYYTYNGLDEMKSFNNYQEFNGWLNRMFMYAPKSMADTFKITLIECISKKD